MRRISSISIRWSSFASMWSRVIWLRCRRVSALRREDQVSSTWFSQSTSCWAASSPTRSARSLESLSGTGTGPPGKVSANMLQPKLWRDLTELTRRWGLLESVPDGGPGDDQLIDQPLVDLEVTLVLAGVANLVTFREHATG